MCIYFVRLIVLRREASGSQTPPEAELTSGKSISLVNLGVTPQTVFIQPPTVGLDARLELRRLRPDLVADGPSRRTSFASRSNRGGGGGGGRDNIPVDQLRQRLASLDLPHPTTTPPLDKVDAATDPAASESALSSTQDAAAAVLPRTVGRRTVDSKALPNVKTITTIAVGTTSTHDDTASGRSTPVPSTTAFGSTAPYSSTYDGADPGVRAYLEHVDLENYREPLLDFGPRIVAGHRKRVPRVKSSTPQSTTMIAHLPQHTGAVTALVTSPDQIFFASASQDTAIMIWDTARLERTVAARPRLTYRMDAPVSALCRIEETHCLAAAAEDGSVHIIRVHVSNTASSPKYRSVECIRTWRTDAKDGHVTHIAHLHGKS